MFDRVTILQTVGDTRPCRHQSHDNTRPEEQDIQAAVAAEEEEEEEEVNGSGYTTSNQWGKQVTPGRAATVAASAACPRSPHALAASNAAAAAPAEVAVLLPPESKIGKLFSPVADACAFLDAIPANRAR